MANQSLENLKGLFRNARTRTIIILTGVVLGLALLVGVIRFFSGTPGPASTAALSGTGQIQSIPGGFDKPETQEYAGLQAQQNLQQAQAAEQQGTSAVPTLIRSSEFQQPSSSPCCIPCGCPGQTTAQNNFPLNKAVDLKPGTLIYDAQGHVLGTVGPDGKIRDANGNVIGTVGPDGLMRDLNGNIVGSASPAAQGTPVYDSTGHLIGTVGPDGKVRDANGNVIGTVGPDGKVRDANGNVIGTAGPDGMIRDAKGNIIGKAPGATGGTPIYDANGHLIGTVGPDGKVRDANGNVIGTAGPDGVVHDPTGRVLGKAGPTYTGTPVYDAQGHLIGIVGPDGKLRDANGRVVGSAGLDGVVRDAQGNPIGTINAPTTTPLAAGAAGTTGTLLPAGAAQGGAGLSAVASLPGSQSSDLQAVMQRQAQMLSQQKAEQLREELQAQMNGQATQLVSAWVAPVQTYVGGNPPTPPATVAAAAAAAAAAKAQQPPMVKAGTVMFGVLTTAINSDQPGPIMATIVGGAFKGGRLLGTLTNQGQTVLLTFNTLSLPDVPQSISINAVAIDQNTARTSFSSYTNNHYFLRYGTLFGSSFLQGFAQALQTSGTTVVSTGLATSQSFPTLTIPGQFIVALGNVGSRYSSVLGNVVNTPPTVYVNAGTAMGVLFLSDVSALPS